nr:choice-of-anchor Q domain-containing protein [Synergistaceae bacterium]
FAENRANNGGAVANWDSSPIIVNCTFSENRAAEHGGALLNDASSPIVVNATFRANRASIGGALFNVAGSPVIANSILWGNGTEVRMEGGTTTITYSIVEGGFSGEGNIDQDPRLGSLANNGGDTHTCAIDEESPAIDAGLAIGTRIAGVIVPALDQRGISRPRGSGVDMGAFEYYDPDDPTPPHGGGGSGGCRTAAGSAGLLTLLLPLLLLRRKRG